MKYQESKPTASIGYKIPFTPDEVLAYPGGVLIRQGNLFYDLEAISEDVTYADFQANGKKKPMKREGN